MLICWLVHFFSTVVDMLEDDYSCEPDASGACSVEGYSLFAASTIYMLA
jgi:hypothetical protein